MSSTVANVRKTAYGFTLRTDKWWVESALVVFGLSCFVIYSTWSAFQGSYYTWGPYLSPFYSPLLWVKEGVAGGAPVDHAWLGPWPSGWPSFLPPSPSF